MRTGDWVRVTESGTTKLRVKCGLEFVRKDEQGVLLWCSNSGIWTVRFGKQTLCLREDMMEAV